MVCSATLTYPSVISYGFLRHSGVRDSLRREAGGAPVAGFYTYGEIARTRGIRGFHNQTLVVLALS